MKRFSVLIFVLVIILALSIIQQFFKPAKPNYNYASIQKGSLIQTTSGLGKVKAFKQVYLSSQIEGIVKQVLVREGDNVNQGKTLFTIESRDLQETEINLLAKLSQLQSDLKQAEFDWQTATEEYRKNKLLYEAKAISGESLDHAKNLLTQANIKLETQNKALAPLQQLIKLNNRKLANRIVISPIKGTITFLPETMRSGSRLLTGQELGIISNTKKLLIETDFDEVEVRKISLGQEAMLRGYILGALKLTGNVYRISPEVRDGKIRVQILLPGSPLLRIGNTVEVEIMTASKSNIFYVPIEAVQEEAGTYFIQVDREGKAQKIPVITGISTPKYIEIKLSSGNIKEGARIILVD